MPGTDPIDSIQASSTAYYGNNINIYFLPTLAAHVTALGEVISTSEWTAQEKAEVMALLSTVSESLDITFTLVTDAASADVTYGWSSFSGGGYAITPAGEIYINEGQRGDSDLTAGSYLGSTIIHEMGHVLGLDHPHTTEGGSAIMNGVTSANDTGDYDLNQAVYSIMSYVVGWETAPGGTTEFYDAGHPGNFMALDIGALQAVYGANTTHAGGDDVYTVISDFATSIQFQTIWDTGGTDEIVYVGLEDAVIDLRAATLGYEVGGGGFMSYASDLTSGYYSSYTTSGFTIANGVVIENATGGDGDDSLTGNSSNNVLQGGLGADAMTGGAGNDRYYIDNTGDAITELAGEGYDIVFTDLAVYTLGDNLERLNFTDGGNHIGKGNALDNRFTATTGNDRFILDEGGADIFSGGQGSDIFDARLSTNGIIIDFLSGTHGGDAAGDTFASIERFYGSSTVADTMTTTTARAKFYGFGGDDVLTGGDTIDFLSGGTGDDILSANGARDGLQGLQGNDTLTGGDDRDYFLYVKSDFGQDTVTDFQDDLDYIKVWVGNSPTNGVADSIADFTLSGNGTATVVVTLNADTANTITLESFDGSNMTIDAGDFLFY